MAWSNSNLCDWYTGTYYKCSSYGGTSQEKGTLMNGFELEKNLDEKKYRQVKTLLLALQCFLLILYVVLFIFFRHYLVALIGLLFCAILPFALTLLAVPKNQN